MAMGDISVAFCADDAYAMPLGIAALSLVRNLAPDRQVEIFVIDGGIFPGNREKILGALSAFRKVRVHWTEFDRKKIANLHGSLYLSAAAYIRIFLPEILPSELTKVLYLDSDMIITGDIALLWDTEFKGHPVLAVQDRAETLGEGVEHFRELGLDPKKPCFNSGLLLLDLESWRKAGLSRRVLDYVIKNQALLRLCDQDALNAVLVGQWGALDRNWNQPIIRPTPESILQLLLSYIPGFRRLPPRPPGILHYLWSGKPWKDDYWFVERRFFTQHLRDSPWAGMEMAAVKRRIRNRVLRYFSCSKNS